MAFSVLIVDDETDFLETVQNRLRKRNYKAFGVTTGQAACEQIRAQDFDAVILDVKLAGGMDGIEVLRRIKRDRPACKVILLTGHISEETRVEGIRLGAFDCLMKPIRLEALEETLSNALQSSASLQ